MTTTRSQIPTCVEHGRSVLDLALGLLDDDRAATAEHALTECPACRSWWREQLEGESAVDDAVAEAFAGFQAPRQIVEAPRRSYRQPWLAAAAVAAACVAGFWALEEQSAVEPAATARAAAEEIFVEDFESDPEVIVVAGQEVSGEPRAEELFASGFESGDAAGWSPES